MSSLTANGVGYCFSRFLLFLKRVLCCNCANQLSVILPALNNNTIQTTYMAEIIQFVSETNWNLSLFDDTRRCLLELEPHQSVNMDIDLMTCRSNKCGTDRWRITVERNGQPVNITLYAKSLIHKVVRVIFKTLEVNTIQCDISKGNNILRGKSHQLRIEGKPYEVSDCCFANWMGCIFGVRNHVWNCRNSFRIADEENSPYQETPPLPPRRYIYDYGAWYGAGSSRRYMDSNGVIVPIDEMRRLAASRASLNDL